MTTGTKQSADGKVVGAAQAGEPELKTNVFASGSLVPPTVIIGVEKSYNKSDAAPGQLFGAMAIAGAVGSFVFGLATEHYGRAIVSPTVTT